MACHGHDNLCALALYFASSKWTSYNAPYLHLEMGGVCAPFPHPSPLPQRAPARARVCVKWAGLVL